MAPRRIISEYQLETMIRYMEQNRELAITSHRPGPLNQRNVVKAWEELALKLNACESFGMLKTPEKWKRYWHLLKCRTKAKAADQRRGDTNSSTPHRFIPLSNAEERIINLLQNESSSTGDVDAEVYITENGSDEDSIEMDPFETIKDQDNNEAWAQTSSPDNEIPDHTDESESQDKKTLQRRSIQPETYLGEKKDLNVKISNFGHKFYINKVDYLKIKIQEEEWTHQRELHRAELKHRLEMHQEELKHKKELHLAELKYKEEVHKEQLKHKVEIHGEELKMKVKEREYLVKNWEIGLQTAVRTARE